MGQAGGVRLEGGGKCEVGSLKAKDGGDRLCGQSGYGWGRGETGAVEVRSWKFEVGRLRTGGDRLWSGALGGKWES